jgi:hypothetical protein
MTATMEQLKETQTMSVIFPTQPPSAQIHLLPRNSQFISYDVDDTLTISAWMPDGFQTITQERKGNNDDFYHENCYECERNCSEFLHEYADEDGEIDWDSIPGGYHGYCNVYDEGYFGQSCHYGYEVGDTDFSLTIAPMVFKISLNHIGEPPRFDRMSDSAYLRAGMIINGRIYATDIMMASNVFGHGFHPEGICWGNNDRPDNLRLIVSQYAATPFNNDLVPINAFEENCSLTRSSVAWDNFHNRCDDIYLCDGKDADAILFADAEKNITAFFTLLSAGFNSLPEAPHVMMIPIKEVEFERDGSYFTGYQTMSDAVDRNWFVSMDGLLVGQV